MPRGGIGRRDSPDHERRRVSGSGGESRSGMKIRKVERPVGVRVPPPAPNTADCRRISRRSRSGYACQVLDIQGSSPSAASSGGIVRIVPDETFAATSRTGHSTRVGNPANARTRDAVYREPPDSAQLRVRQSLDEPHAKLGHHPVGSIPLCRRVSNDSGRAFLPGQSDKASRSCGGIAAVPARRGDLVADLDAAVASGGPTNPPLPTTSPATAKR